VVSKLKVASFREAFSAPSEIDPLMPSPLHGYFGGAYTSEGNFIEQSRTWRASGIPVVYPSKKTPILAPVGRIPGRTLFAGPIFGHYGHFLLESTARLWPIVANNFDKILFQFPQSSAWNSLDYQKSIIELSGISKTILVTRDVYQFEELFVPDPALILSHSISKEFLTLFDLIGSQFTSSVKDVGMVYVSRTSLDIGVTVGECFLERAFADEGYNIFHPERHSIREQIHLFINASHVAGIQGSGLHNVIFCRKSTPITIFVRDESSVTTFQLVNRVRELGERYLYTASPLNPDYPPFHAQGPFLIDFEKLEIELRRSGLANVANRLIPPPPEILFAAFISEWNYVRARKSSGTAVAELASKHVRQSRTKLSELAGSVRYHERTNGRELSTFSPAAKSGRQARRADETAARRETLIRRTEMHASAAMSGKYFFEAYAGNSVGKILDVGSLDVSGSLRSQSPAGWDYVGIDIAPGPGVDLVNPPGDPFPFADSEFDLAVSLSCFEHDQCFWFTFTEMMRVVKPSGFVYISAPSNGPYHGFPFDNWRFYPDAGRALASWARRNALSTRLVESGILRQNGSDWNDFFATFQRGEIFSEPKAYIYEKFPDSMNIRRGEADELINFVEITQDRQKYFEANHLLKFTEAKLREAEKRLKAIEKDDRIV
jgi:SAM-dependent methyltransferase